MAKLAKRLEEMRDDLIMELDHKEVSARDIATIFDMTTSAIYNIIKESKIINKKGQSNVRRK